MEEKERLVKTLDVFDTYMKMKMKHYEKARQMHQKAAKDEIDFIKEIKSIFEEDKKPKKSTKDQENLKS